MSSAQGFPDWQRITQWLGPPIVQNTGLVIGAALHTDGPYQVSNFASVMVALKAAVGNVTVTIKQTVPAGPASLVLTETVIVPAGSTLFEAFVLFGGAVELDLTGSVAGTSVDYALYGSNTTTNAQVITNATINVQHNDVLVAAEPTLDFVDAAGFVWSVVDDGPGTRVKITPPALAIAKLFDTELAAAAATIDIQNIPQTYLNLRLVLMLRETGAPTRDTVYIDFNNDFAGHYEDEYVDVVGATAPAANGAVGGGFGPLGNIPGTGATAGRFASHVVDIPLYSDASAVYARAKNYIVHSVLMAGGALNTAERIGGGTWDNAGVATAINRITLTPGTGNIAAGSRIIGYGLS